jgi:hypothetical protein
VRVQACTAFTAVQGGLQARLQQRAAEALQAVEVQVLAPEDFPGRPHIDFERKFAYCAPRVG